MAETKKFRLITERPYTTLVDILSYDGVSREKVSLVCHMPQFGCSVFNILGIAVVVDYSRKDDVCVHMASIGERTVRPAVSYIEDRFHRSRLLEDADSLKVEDIKELLG